MAQMIKDLSESLTEDLYEKTRAQLRSFIAETNALLAAGDAVQEDRTDLARQRLAEFLAQVEDYSEAPIVPPVTRAASRARDYVMTHPWRAVAAAAGVGILVSVLLSRK